jgi:hypothetical protein
MAWLCFSVAGHRALPPLLLARVHRHQYRLKYVVHVSSTDPVTQLPAALTLSRIAVRVRGGQRKSLRHNSSRVSKASVGSFRSSWLNYIRALT